MKSPKRNREFKKNEVNYSSKNQKWRPVNFNESYGEDDDEDGWEDVNSLYSL